MVLRESLERYAADRYSFANRAALLGAPAALRAHVWRDYAEMGWLALRLPADVGGIEADATAIGIVMETVGARLLMEPILASAVLGTGLVLKQASPAQRAALLPELAGGTVSLAVAWEPAMACELRDGRLHGRFVSVLHGDVAHRFVVAARDEQGAAVVCVVAAEAAGVRRRTHALVDGRGAAAVVFDGARAERLDPGPGGRSAGEALRDMLDEAACALCAEALGVIRSLVDATAAYLKLRSQFGKPLAANQALQHRLTELYLLQQETAALARRAERAWRLPAPERGRIVSGAWAYAAGAARKVANEAVQLHGGVGVTEELDVSHYFRRAMVVAAQFGGRDRHVDRFLAEDPA